MIQFFRENKSVRDTVIGVVAVLFCISAVFGGRTPSSKSLSVGKRQVNTHHLHAQYQQLVQSHPDLDKKAIEQDLIHRSLLSLKQAKHIEDMGLIPTPTQLKKTIRSILPKHIPLDTAAKQQNLTQNQLLLSISDQLALEQLTKTIRDSSIVTSEQQSLHSQVFHQNRTYIDIDLSQGQYPEDPEAYQAIFDQQQFRHPKQYHYTYIDITPDTLGLPEITESMIQAYFQEHLTTYADQDLEYQITTYIPAKSSKATHKVWPNYIQTDLESFQKKHPHYRITTKTHSIKRSKLPKEHQIVEKLSPGQHAVLEQKDTFKVISLVQRKTANTLDPNQREALKARLSESTYSHALQSKLNQLSEEAYTQPKDLTALANRYGFVVHTQKTEHSADIESLLSDSDFTDKHYISEAVKVSELHYRFLQLQEISPEKPMTYEEALDNIQSIYREKVLYPKIETELAQAHSLAEIHTIAKTYGLSVRILNTQDDPSSTVFGLVPTRSLPHPSALENHHWQRLEKIEAKDSEDDEVSYLIQQLDSQILLSALYNAAQTE